MDSTDKCVCVCVHAEYIDLIIPRGSNEFVQYVMQNTDIAVLGHADGVSKFLVNFTYSKILVNFRAVRNAEH